MRRDIQFVRALAVGMVLAYHLWPERFPGGFTGVDVFFVISGFLITAHLLRDVDRHGRVDVVAFWGRRALRLLPLATAVLIATSVAIALWSPPSAWRPALEGVIASTLYVQNWTLAASSVDYLARDQAPLPTQHFWSLSAEEQFYLAWPVILIAALATAALITRRARADLVRPAWAIAIALVGLASFGYSLWMTAAEPGVAYFSTATRAWEFAAGAALAFLPPLADARALPRRTVVVAAGSSWLGLAAVLASIFFIVEGTPFPGVAAIVPVLGTVLLLWAGAAAIPATPARFGNFRPIERIGDLSYGIYLWHWPIIVIAPSALGRPLTTIDKVVLVVVVIVLAEFSKRGIEDPFRYGVVWQRSRARRFVPGLVGMTVAIAVALGASAVLGVSLFRSPGAAAGPDLTRPVPTSAPQSVADLRPQIPDRGVDYAVMYDCFDFDASGPYRCEYGDPSSSLRLALVGDSHAAHWIPGLVEAASAEAWSLTTFVGMNCDGLRADACWGGDDIIEQLAAGDFDLILFGAFRGSSTPAQDVRGSIEALAGLDAPLALFVDVPLHPRSAFECLDENYRDITAALTCSAPVDEALSVTPDRLTPLAAEFGLPVIDVTEDFCDDRRCASILGSIVVYQDSPSSHLTTTMLTALAEPLADRLRELLR